MQKLSASVIYEKAYQQVLQRTANSELYKKLILRRYNEPKGYRASDLVLFNIATSILGAGTTKAHYLFHNPLLLFNVELCNHFVENNCKPYWVDEDFFASVLNAGDFDFLSNNLPSSISCGVLLFPTELSPRNPEGYVLDWVVFAIVESGESLSSFVQHDNSYQSEPLIQDSMVWTAMAADSSCYGATILADGMIYAHLPQNYEVTPQEHHLVYQLSHIVLHTLNYAQNPEYETVINPAPRKLGFGKNTKIATEKLKLKPEWIGREIKIYPRIKDASINTGGRKSPCEHERKEHTRTVRYGKGRALTKIVTIPATIVSIKQEHESHLASEYL